MPLQKSFSRIFCFLFLLFVILNSGFLACNPGFFLVGGTVNGLSGTLVLKISDGQEVTVENGSSFQFTAALPEGSPYTITVETQPASQLCSIANPSGTINSANIINVEVTCVITFKVGGTLSGLSGAVVLQDNGGNDLSLDADGDFIFTDEVADGASYAVTVLTQPATQTCSVANGSGTISSANVINVEIICSTHTYTVGGTVSGLTGTVILQNNASDSTPISANGAFTFSTAVADGAGYAVTVSTPQPTGQTCSVTSGSGSISGANVSDVAVVCVDSSASKIIFVTLGTNEGNFGGSVAGADALCMADARYPGTGTYKALIVDGSRTACTTDGITVNCDPSVHVDWVLAASTEYVRTDGTTTIGTTNVDGVFVFPLDASWSEIAGENTWTGLNADWTTDITGTCSSWGPTGVEGAGGAGIATSSASIFAGVAPCGLATLNLVCVEQ